MADCFQYVVFAEVIYLYGIEFFPCQNLLVRYQSAIRSDFGHIGILCPGTDRPFQKPDIAVKILGIRTSFQGDDFFRRRSGNGCRKMEAQPESIRDKSSVSVMDRFIDDSSIVIRTSTVFIVQKTLFRYTALPVGLTGIYIVCSRQEGFWTPPVACKD